MRRLKLNKKGQLEPIVIIIVVFIITVAGGLFWYVFDQMGNEMNQDPDLAPHMEPYNKSVESMSFLNWGTAAIFVVMVIGFIASMFFVGSHPWIFVPWIILIIILGLIAPSLSNAYYDLTQDQDLGNFYLTKMPLPTKILFNLPFIVVLLGLIGTIALAAKWASDNKDKTPW